MLADSLHSQNARERTRNSRVVAGLCEYLENKVNNGRILRIVTISLANLNMCCLSLNPQISISALTLYNIVQHVLMHLSAAIPGGGGGGGGGDPGDIRGHGAGFVNFGHQF